MKKLFLLIIFCIIPTFAMAKDIKLYNSNYRYVGKISSSGKIYDKNYNRVGKVDLNSGKVYDRNYNRVGSVRSTFRGRR